MRSVLSVGVRVSSLAVRRQALSVVITALCACVIVMSGCGHPTLQASLPSTSNTPVPLAGEPTVTAVSPATVVAAGPSFTLTVTGTNFAAGDTVEWNFAQLQSTFVSPTMMTALVPNQLIYKSGAAGIIVQPPVPYPLTFGIDVTVIDPPVPGSAGFSTSTVSIQANDMVWNSSTQEIYLSVAATNPTNQNTVIPLNPASGQLGAAVSAGTGANHLGVSSDGSWLYAGIDQSGAVQRFALPGLTRDITISLGAVSSQPYYALALEPAPGSPNTIAVSKVTNAGLGYAGNESVVLYDGATPRSETVTGGPGPLQSLAWSNTGTSLYSAYGRGQSQETVFVLGVSSSGVQLLATDKLNMSSSVIDLGGIHASALTGYLYGDSGYVISAASGTVVNTLPLNAVQGGSGITPLLTLDDNLGIAYALEQPVNSPQHPGYAIEAFDLRTDALLGSIAIPNVVGTPVKLIRWGTNGLALLTTGTNGGVYLISGAFVTTPTVQMRGGGWAK